MKMMNEVDHFYGLDAEFCKNGVDINVVVDGSGELSVVAYRIQEDGCMDGSDYKVLYNKEAQ